MSVRFVTFTMHDGRSVIKINPQQVNYLLSQDGIHTKIHFGVDQTVDVVGSLETVESSLSRL